MASREAEFCNYLELHNVMSTLAVAVKSLHQEHEKPDNPLGYVVDKICMTLNIEPYETLRSQLQLKEKLEELKTQNKQLKEAAEACKKAN